MDDILHLLNDMLEPSIVLLLMVLLLMLNTWVFKNIQSNLDSSNVTKGVVSFVLILIGLLVFILSLPIKESLKGQILSFLGIIISAGFALSSTTVLGNLIAGVMNNSMNRFRNGDLIKINEMYGRVIKKKLLHTEIQLEDSNFITIPNLYIAQHPVKLVRTNNTVISSTVSLGYDVNRERIEEALKEAASSIGLRDPYVFIKSLGDFSVVYKIHGFLEDSSKYFSTTSLLNAKVMDYLHAAKIEIVSPTFMNQRRADEQMFIPKKVHPQTDTTPDTTPEDLVFSEAIASQKIENKKDYITQVDEKINELKHKLKNSKTPEEEASIKTYIEKYEALKLRLEKSVGEELTAEKKQNDKK